MNLWLYREQEPNERVFNSPLDAGAVELACAIIEQAVIDWKTLDYGKLKRTIGNTDSTYIYAGEVESFFKSRWFEHLLTFALPEHTPQEIRKLLRIPEPRRRKKRCERV